jgi:predicted transposase YdaD
MTEKERKITLTYDNICKYLAEQYPSEFVQWLCALSGQNVEVLKTELTLEPIRADFVTFLQTENQILHLEFQTKPPSNPPIPFRMLDYSVRLKRQYQCSVMQVVIFLQESTNEIAFTEVYQDDTTIHRYRAIRLWEQDSSLFLDNPALLPLAPLTRTDSPQGLLQRVAERIARIDDNQQRQNLAGCTEVLAGLRFEKEIIRQFLREEMMRESVIYQDIWEKSRKQEAFSFLTRLLNRRLGSLEESIMEKMRVLSVEQLEDLGEALLDFSETLDLVVWLDRQSG